MTDAVYAMLEERMKLARDYVDDGAFVTAAKVLRGMSDALDRHAAAARAAALRPVIQALTVTQQNALADTARHKLVRKRGGWTANSIHFFADRTIKVLEDRDLIKINGPKGAVITAAGEEIVVALFGSAFAPAAGSK